MQYFGEPWPSGVCEDGEQVATPFGQPCLWCDEPIDENDQGVLMPSFVRKSSAGDYMATIEPLHLECFLRQTIGSLGHLLGKCSCFVKDGTSMEDPPGLTTREAAIAAYTYWMRRGGAE